VNKDCQLLKPERKNGAKTTRLSCASSSNPLLDHPSTKIGANQTPICLVNCIAKFWVANFVLPRKRAKGLFLKMRVSFIRVSFTPRSVTLSVILLWPGVGLSK
jgi:hypothetical protein